MVCHRSVLALIDHRLRMLRAHADRERFRRHRNALVPKHARRIACAVPDCKDQRRTRFPFRRLSVPQQYMRYSAILHSEIAQRRGKPHFPARLLDAFPKTSDGFTQAVRADMRLCKIADLFRCAAFDQRFQHAVDMRIADTRRQLAVRKRARAAFTERHIAVRIRFPDAAAPVAFHIFDTLFDRASSFDHQRTVTMLCERPCRKQSRRTEPDDDDPAVLPFAAEHRRFFGRRIDRFRAETRVVQYALRRCIRQRQFRVNAVKDILLFARVKRLPHDAHPDQRVARNIEFFTAGSGERFVRRIKLAS